MTADKTAHVLDNFAETLSNAPDLHGVFTAAEAVAQTLIGHRLFTIMRFDAARMVVERVHSSNPEAYPIGGRKPKRDSEWRRHVLEEGKVFIGHNSDDIRWVFDDSELILGLGLHAVLNVPIKSAGRIVGTMNLLDRTAHYRARDAEIGAVIAAQLADVLDVSASASD
ncbi:GAF domain-containing protein [Denitrobaculum tricleocarpae]|nr:GAF domain-containing protein [Denitrobaculum tricleocarpae]